MLERSAVADLFKNTLSKIPTVFGQLGYLAGLRDPDSGIYRHHGLAAIFGRDESRKALAESHDRVFQQWLNLSLENKTSDLVSYLGGLREPKDAVLKHWKRSSVYQSYLPGSARDGERLLYLEEFDVLIDALNCTDQE